ncbi:MAG: mersacidin/lichenicidin family type 2 lantibiotic [Stigonema ocellatum SAG 48.90 = DSM 106950]|nr:mersacidin/lichenicidin family type 2 lantibiotic [Stigonema ocellatum SAG 48.90 = DSM 106950]
MSNVDIIRAWKDENYRNSLSDEQHSLLPKNPAGMIELSDEEMESIVGGYKKGLGGLGTGTGTTGGLCNGCCFALTCIIPPDLNRGQ